MMRNTRYEIVSYILSVGNSGSDLLAKIAVTTWLTASKKKNLDTTKVFTSITELAAMTAIRPIMFITRIALRIIYPGPARERLKKDIFRTVDIERVEMVSCKDRTTIVERLT